MAGPSTELWRALGFRQRAPKAPLLVASPGARRGRTASSGRGCCRRRRCCSLGLCVPLFDLTQRDFVAIPAVDVPVEVQVDAAPLELALVVDLPDIRLAVVVGVDLRPAQLAAHVEASLII